MRESLAAAMVIGLVACHKTPEVEPRPLRVVGDYAYRMQIGTVPISGEFSIEKDTVWLEAADHSCRRNLVAPLTESPLSHSFTCGGGPATSFQVVLNSKQPTLSAWSSSQPVKKSQQVCVKYTTTKEGQQICSQSRREPVIVNERIQGRLEVTRIAASDKP